MKAEAYNSHCKQLNITGTRADFSTPDYNSDIFQSAN